MKINKLDKISDVQKRFNDRYPLLKLKFYKEKHSHFKGSLKENEVDDETKLVEINPDIKDGLVAVANDITVDNLETSFEENFALHVQVFRKSGAQWLQTSVTDFWTLQQHVESAERSELAQK